MKTLHPKTALRALTVALLAGSMGVAMADDPKTRDGGMDKVAERESSQPVSDTWITTKVKADLLATEDVSGLELNVETVEGVVSLSGEVESQAEVDRAAEVARDIKGVARVDTSRVRIDRSGNP